MKDRFTFMVDTCEQLNRSAHEILRTGKVEVWHKPDDTKVTTVDERLNEEFMAAVTKEFPNDNVWGEEGSKGEKGDLDSANKNWTWLIDPIDGTSGFVRAIKAGTMRDCTSAIMITGIAPGETTPTMAIVDVPFGDIPHTVCVNGLEAYAKMRGNQWNLTNRFKYWDYAQVDRYEENDWSSARTNLPRTFITLFPLALKIKCSSIGRAASLLAMGHLDVVGFPDPSNPHDIAPAALIGKAAGCVVTDLEGNGYEDIDWRVGELSGLLITKHKNVTELVLGSLIRR